MLRGMTKAAALTGSQHQLMMMHVVLAARHKTSDSAAVYNKTTQCRRTRLLPYVIGAVDLSCQSSTL